MSDSVTELSLRWKRDPDVANTIALANVVRGSIHATLIQEVGAFATDRLGDKVPVLLAVARMYMSAQRFSDAQAILVAAGKLAPRDAGVYRILGEVLLRRGDAERSEKVLERAMQLGATDSGTRLWLDRSRIFKSMQARAGTTRLAAEVERTAPAAASDLTPHLDPPSERTMPIADESDEPPTAIRMAMPASTRSVSPGSAAPPSSRHPPPPPVPSRASSRPMAAGTGENPFGAGAAAAGLTPAGMPKAPHAFLFDKDDPVAAARRPLEESVTFNLGAAPLPRHIMPSIAEVPLDPQRGVGVATAPKPRELLDALGHAGIFEPEARQGAKAEWAAAAKGPRKRGTWLLIGVMMLFGGGAFGTYRYVEQQRTLKRAAADNLMAEIEAGLFDGSLAKIGDLESAFGRAFELDSRSSRAALAWTRERALVGLVRGGQDVAFEDAINRARAVGVKDADLAFTQIASFLFQNDTAGAVSLLPRHDAAAGNDPWYQLLAGTCLERLGDARAADRYAAALKLSKDFVPAQVALTRHEILEGDRARAIDLVSQFRARHGERPEALALAALLWARDPARPKPPPEALEIVTKREALPLTLAAVPFAVSARIALEKGALPDARDAIRRGLAASDGPGVASWLGFLALDADDEMLARKAALTAVGYSAVYPRARALAARVALLGGRLDEALKATDELDAAQTDVALARAIVAYERADADGLARALEGVSPENRASNAMAPAVLAQGALAGKSQIAATKLVARSAAEELWSDVVAMDIALDTANLDAASAIGNRWLAQTPKDKLPALRAARLSRLARYQDRLDDADALSALALIGTAPTLRTITERVFVLAARERPLEIGPLLAKYATAAGPLASWFGAYATAIAGKADDARGRSSNLEPPPDSAPAPVRIPVAAALGAMKDKKRGAALVRSLLDQNQVSPDVITAAQGVGLRPAPKK